MIIDDEPAHVRGIMKHINWEGLGYDNVVGMFCAREAIKRLQDETFDLVLTDINMPDINGLELIRRIYLLGKEPNIIIISGYNEFTYAQEAIRLGVCEYILKPVKPEEIEESVLLLNEKARHGHLHQDKMNSLDIDNDIIIGDNKKNSTHPIIQKILLFIGKNYTNEITVQEIADKFQINESYLSVLFKKEIGLNFSVYLQKFRLHKAMELLKIPELRINEIAYRVGYQNPSYFTEQFKKEFNITPSEFRKV
mgnify:CR=1 FL=1